MSPSAAADIRDYIASQPPESRKRLKEIRELVRVMAPRAEEVFSYRMPGFRLEGRQFIWYAAFKHHTSLFPMTDAIRRAHAAKLKGYETAKGTVRIPLDAPFPIPLVKTLIRARMAEVRAAARARR